MTCYAAFAKDLEIRMSGSSGGLFPIISQHFIENGGLVYAAEYDNSFHVVFNRYDTLSDLRRSFTSKYVQSRLKDTFSGIKTDLKSNHRVLFCGTPCQTAALQQYLKNCKVDTTGLLTLNFICHGVPSEDVFQQYMSRFSSPSCTSLNMRSKDLGWDYGGFAWKMTFEDHTQSTTPQAKVSYMRGFLSNLYLRPSCYNCRKEFYESADITLGDFWTISTRYPDIPSRHGVSCVLLRSQKGDTIFSEVKNNLEYFPVNYTDIAPANPCLESPTKKPYFRTQFFKKLRKHNDLDALIANLSAPSYKNRIINKLYSFAPKRPTPATDLPAVAQRTIFSSKEQCCGCVACYNICPTKAIILKKDHEGFIYPVINTDKCTECRLCESVCPFITTN